MEILHRFWFTFKQPPQFNPLGLGCGVTAYSCSDASGNFQIPNSLHAEQHSISIVWCRMLTSKSGIHVIPNMVHVSIRGLVSTRLRPLKHEMKTDLTLDFVWIPPELGGHSAGPFTGMRLTIRCQRYLEAYLQCARDVECRALTFDPKTLRGQATCALSSDEPVPKWLQNGQLVELLNGFRVLAIGKIT